MKTNTTLIFTLILMLLPLSAMCSIRWQTTHGNLCTGNVRLEKSSMSVTVHDNYLDVEEEAIIATTGNVCGTGDPNSLEIFGDFRMTEGTTIVGMLLWNGDVILKGKLKSKVEANAEYEDVVDRNITPPPRPRDPALIEQLGQDNYQIKIYPVTLGNSRRVRIRYYVPSHAGNDIYMELQSIFQPNIADRTGKMEVSFKRGTSQAEFQLSYSGVTGALELPGTYLLPSGINRIRLSYPASVKSMAALTEFTQGPFQGHYMGLNSLLPLEVQALTGLRVEVVVFWKWHNPYFFMNDRRDDLSFYGDKAVDQSKSIRDLFEYSAPNYRMGLVHDDTRNRPQVFRLARKGDEEYVKIIQHLKRVGDREYIKDESLSINNPRKENSQNTLKTAISSLKTDLYLVKSLFSTEKGIVRHIVLATVGPITNVSANEDISRMMSTVFEDEALSVSLLNDAYSSSSPNYARHNGFNWYGLDTRRILDDYRISGSSSRLTSTWFPQLENYSVEAQIKNADNAYILPLKCYSGLSLSCEPINFYAKASTAWSPEINWRVFDKEGKLVGQVEVEPDINREISNDAALATLWAGSPYPYAENDERYLGARYGFVDNAMSLLALEEDSIGRAAQGDWESAGVPLLTANDIVPPDTNYVFKPSVLASNARGTVNLAEIQATLVDNGVLSLRIVLPQELSSSNKLRVTLYDINGHMIQAWELSSIGQRIFKLDIPHLNPGLYILRFGHGSASTTRRILIN